MRVKISDFGILLISRAGKFKLQRCPFSTTVCSDLCPLFGEPELVSGKVRLEICRKTFVIEKDNFIDERGKNET